MTREEKIQTALLVSAIFFFIAAHLFVASI